jgi:hypothetical protein
MANGMEGPRSVKQEDPTIEAQTNETPSLQDLSGPQEQHPLPPQSLPRARFITNPNPLRA